MASPGSGRKPEPAGGVAPSGGLVEDIAALVRGAGGRMTTGRRALLEALVQLGGHPTAEQLLGAVRRAQPEVDSSTIYRNLAQLEELGVVVHVHLAHGPAVYHLAGDDHAHIVCDGCRLVAEVPGEVVRALRQAFSSHGGFGLTWQHFAWTGLCADCQATAADAGAPEGRKSAIGLAPPRPTV